LNRFGRLFVGVAVAVAEGEGVLDEEDVVRA